MLLGVCERSLCACVSLHVCLVCVYVSACVFLLVFVCAYVEHRYVCVRCETAMRKRLPWLKEESQTDACYLNYSACILIDIYSLVGIYFNSG